MSSFSVDVSQQRRITCRHLMSSRLSMRFRFLIMKNDIEEDLHLIFWDHQLQNGISLVKIKTQFYRGDKRIQIDDYLDFFSFIKASKKRKSQNNLR